MQRLFAYGTMNQRQGPAELADLLTEFVPAGEASVRGRLYQLQTYPGLVLDDQADAVHGQLFDVPDGVWQRLDEYEGFDPQVRESSLFLRVKAAVQRPDGTSEEVWIYVYNRHTGE